ncbi:MAG: hypothetical protein ACXVXP_06230 [Mycobacteriaceae bacterium]
MSARRAVAPPPEADALVAVTPVPPFQVSHEGEIAAPGESLSVPEEVAARWELQGVATRVPDGEL